jgi:hypothetical protein
MSSTMFGCDIMAEIMCSEVGQQEMKNKKK